MGMAHRGRLNVLSNVLGKSHRQIFGEFEGELKPDTVQGSGDVKYHLGAHGTYTARSGATVELHLPPNPSHLEAVDPVVEGIVRAKQDRYDRGDAGEFPVLPLLIHGDAAFAGQGVVFETLHLSQLRGYRTGGTVHVVINNQVGFTTSPDSSRSSHYATDVAKAVQAPIVHVNGDDPEAVVRVARLAFDYRQASTATSSSTSSATDATGTTRPTTRRSRSPRCTASSTSALRASPLHRAAREARRSHRRAGRGRAARLPGPPRGRVRGGEGGEAAGAAARLDRPSSAACCRPRRHRRRPELLDRVAEVNFAVPDGFRRHPKLDRILKRAHERYREGEVDWALGEALAFGTLLAEGTWVRLAGQDSRRGTFSHRHAVQVDFETGEEHVALAHLGEGRASSSCTTRR
jgi:multifunctional 2-oxoglutarate metabolism enzyme